MRGNQAFNQRQNPPRPLAGTPDRLALNSPEIDLEFPVSGFSRRKIGVETANSRYMRQC